MIEDFTFTGVPSTPTTPVSQRVSYMYLTDCEIVVEGGKVVACDPDEEHPVTLPADSVAFIMLGPEVLISTEAMSMLTREGAMVSFTGDGGTPAYTTVSSVGTSARWAHAQARMWADRFALLDAARKLYGARFPNINLSQSLSVESLRDTEQKLMRDVYKAAARRGKVRGFKRDRAAEDTVNQCLNVGAQMLYGAASSAISALGLSPALGIIHQGNARSLQFDLADVHKASITIPAAFIAASHDDPIASMRSLTRKAMDQRLVIESMIGLLTDILAPHVSEDSDVDQIIGSRTNHPVEVHPTAAHRGY